MADSWGTPEQQTFEKRNVRGVAVGDHRLKVHRHLVPIVEHALISLADHDLPVSVASYPESPDGRDLILEPNDNTTAKVMLSHGFTPVDDAWRFEKPIEEAKLLADAFLDETALGDIEDQSEGEESPLPTNGPLPGSRALSPGDEGQDVVYLQAYLGIERTGVYDETTVGEVAYALSRRNLDPGNGTLDRDRWRSFLPTRWWRLRPGDGGRGARMFNAALIAHFGVAEAECRSMFVRWTRETLYRLQEEQEITRSPRVSILEWMALVEVRQD